MEDLNVTEETNANASSDDAEDIEPQEESGEGNNGGSNEHNTT